MPSKRKKNKRRMRRVQAQRRVLEEQYSSSGKGTPGVCAVSAPVPALVPKAKTSECPLAVPIPLPVIAPVEVPLVLEVPVKDEVVKAAVGLEQALVEPHIKETAVIEEDESVTIPVSEVTSSIDEPVTIPAESEIQFEDTRPVATETLVTSPVGTECEVPAEGPVVELETVPPAEIFETVTETVAEVEPAVDAAVEVDGPVVKPVEDSAVEVDGPVVKPVVDAAVEVDRPTVKPVEDSAVEVDGPVVKSVVDAAVEVDRPTVKPVIDAAVEVDGLVVESIIDAIVEADGPVKEPVIDSIVEADGPVVEPVVEPEAITVETEPPEVHTVAEVIEDVYPEPEAKEFPVKAALPAEALVEPDPEQPIPLQEPTPSVESTIDPIPEEIVVAESIIAVDTTIAEEQIPATKDAPEVLSKTAEETVPAPEPLPVPVAKEIIQAQDEFLAQVEAETIKDLAVGGSRNVDGINGCLGVTEVAIEG